MIVTTEIKIDGKPYKPLSPKYEEFHNDRTKHRVIFGSWGSGKTIDGLCVEAIIQMAMYENNLGLIVRKEFTELATTTMLEFERICPKELISNINKQYHRWDFVNGSTLFFTNMKDVASGEYQKKQKAGINLGFVGFDEMDEITEEQFLLLAGRLRRPGTEQCSVGVCNIEGKNWIWRLFLNQEGLEHKEYYKGWITYSDENPYIKEYVKDLRKTMPVEWIRRYLECDFESYSGLVYSEFNEKIHKIPAIEKIPMHWKVLGSFDYGFRNPTCFIFFALDPYNVLHIVDTYYDSERQIEYVAKEIKRMIKTRPDIIIWADPQCFHRESSGRTIAEEYRDYGIVLRCGDNAIKPGIDHIKWRLKNNKLLVHDTGNNLPVFKEFSTYKWKHVRPSAIGQRSSPEEPVKKDDHAMDTIRYADNAIRFNTEIYYPLGKEPEEVAPKIRDVYPELYEKTTKGKVIKSCPV